MSTQKSELSVEKICEQFKARSVSVVMLAEDPDEERTSWMFEGDVSDLADIAVATGSKAVFVYAESFDDAFFEFTPDDDGELFDGDDHAEETSESIRLTEFEPRLKAFEKHVGEHYLFRIFATVENTKICLDTSPGWFEDFVALRDPVWERLEASADERAHAQKLAWRTQLDDDQKRLKREIDELASNREFQSLKTKAAMTAFVEKSFPEAKKTLGTFEFRERITLLYQNVQLERSRR